MYHKDQWFSVELFKSQQKTYGQGLLVEGIAVFVQGYHVTRIFLTTA